MASKLFNHFPDKPTHMAVQNAFIILESTHEAASSFLQIFNSTRQTRKAVNAPSDVEQDLLRAMLLFASAGLDSMVKQLINDALPLVVEYNTGAQERFKQFVERKLKRGEGIDYKFLAEAITDQNPRQILIEQLIYELSSASLQSVDQIFKVASYFDIPSNKIVKTEDQNLLREIFNARNDIAHEMDVDLTQEKHNRRPRTKHKMIEYTNLIFQVSEAFLKEVDIRLPSVASE